jgi:hypothetical protein
MRARFDVVFGGDYRENLGEKGKGGVAVMGVGGCYESEVFFACVWGGGDRSRITDYKERGWGRKGSCGGWEGGERRARFDFGGG